MTRQMVAAPMSASTEQGKSRVTVILATTLQMTGKRVQVMCLHAFSENTHNFSFTLSSLNAQTRNFTTQPCTV